MLRMMDAHENNEIIHKEEGKTKKKETQRPGYAFSALLIPTQLTGFFMTRNFSPRLQCICVHYGIKFCFNFLHVETGEWKTYPHFYKFINQATHQRQSYN